MLLTDSLTDGYLPRPLTSRQPLSLLTTPRHCPPTLTPTPEGNPANAHLGPSSLHHCCQPEARSLYALVGDSEGSKYYWHLCLCFSTHREGHARIHGVIGGNITICLAARRCWRVQDECVRVTKWRCVMISRNQNGDLVS